MLVLIFGFVINRTAERTNIKALPINLNEYHPKWPLITRLVRVHRAKNMCERCGVFNQSAVHYWGRHIIDKSSATILFWWLVRHKGYTELQAQKRVWETYRVKVVYIVLAVAHLDHNPDNNRFDNLACLCQRCHLRHDLAQHVASIKYGKNRHLNQLDLFADEETIHGDPPGMEHGVLLPG